MSRRRGRSRRAALGAGAAALLLALAVGDLAFALHPDQLARRLERALGEALQSDVTLTGFEISLDASVRVASVIVRPRTARAGGGGGAGGAEGMGAPGAGRLDASLAVGVRLRLRRPELLRLAWVIDEIEIDEVDTGTDLLQALVTALRAQRGSQAVSASVRVTVRRLELAIGGAAGSLSALAGGSRVALEHVHFAPEGATPGLWRADMTYRASQLERVALRARLDLAQGRLAVAVRASNVEADGRLLAALPPDARRWLERLAPRGPVDLDLDLEMPWDDPSALAVSGSIGCHTLHLAPAPLEQGIANVRGRVRVDGESLRIEGLRGQWEGAEVHLRGSIQDARTLAGVDLVLTVSELRLGALPQVAPAEAIARLEPEGQAHLTLRAQSGAGVPLAQAELTGELELQQASAFGGLASKLHGAIAIRRSGTPARWRFDLGPVSAQVAGVALQQVTGSLVHDNGVGRVDGLAIQLGGGQLTGAIRAGPAPGALRVDLAGNAVPLALVGRALFETAELDGELSQVRLGVQQASVGEPMVGRLTGLLRGVDPFRLPQAGAVARELERLGLEPATTHVGRFALALTEDGAEVLEVDLAAVHYRLVLTVRRAPSGELSGELTVRSPGGQEVLAGLEVAGRLPSPRFR